jgi:hypothetical protein
VLTRSSGVRPVAPRRAFRPPQDSSGRFGKHPRRGANPVRCFPVFLFCFFDLPARATVPAQSGLELFTGLSVNTWRFKRQGRFNTHNPAASAANASGFPQTSLSEVTRRSRSRRAPAFLRRVTPDRVIAFITS